MNAISNSNLLQSLGWAVFNSLWQLALLWVAYQLIIAVFRVRKSSVKGILATSFLLTGFAWFVFTFISLLVSGASNFTSAGFININKSRQINEWLGSVLPGLSVVYLVLLLLPVLNFVRNYRYVQVIRTQRLSKADVYWRIFAQKIASQMGINRPVTVWMSELISSPVTIGYLKPVILLPLASINHLTTDQTEAILLHELAHIRRYDYFFNLLARFIRTILYFNPFAKAFGKIIEKEREKSCDETVLQFQYEPHNYASALVSLEKASYLSEQSFAVSASGDKKGDFRERIEWILGIGKKPSFSFTRLAGVIIALFCFAGLNAMLIMNKSLSKGKSSDPFALLSSPFQFSNDNKSSEKNISSEVGNPSIVNNASENSPISYSGDQTQSESASAWNNNAGDDDLQDYEMNEEKGNESGVFPYVYVNHLEEIIPQLDEQKEQMVQEALAESKRVIQETKWKEVEKNIADAMTLAEKNRVKAEYEKVLNGKLDLEKMGNQLRLAYDQINWDKINVKLDNAIAEIKIDSLQTVYSIALSNLSDLQKELVKVKQTGVPDSDISVKSIEVKKKELEKAINTLKTVRSKKIVHL